MSLRIAVLAVDPTRRKGGGALLGDRIRMNSLDGDDIYFRSMATRGAATEVPEVVNDVYDRPCPNGNAASIDRLLMRSPS